MKIKFGAEQKKYIYVSEIPAVKELISELQDKDNYGDFSFEIGAAVTCATGTNSDSFQILKKEAEIAKNHRIYNHYSDNSGTLDIWFTIYAYDHYYGFFEIGCYLSDIWAISSENVDEIRSHMLIYKFTKEGK